MARAKSSSTATPTHNFTPKFKRGDVCKIKNCRQHPELNGLIVTILSSIQVFTDYDQPHLTWLGYETDLCYLDRWIFPPENKITKIGEVSL